jgi:hypothetical protein
MVKNANAPGKGGAVGEVSLEKEPSLHTPLAPTTQAQNDARPLNVVAARRASVDNSTGSTEREAPFAWGRLRECAKCDRPFEAQEPVWRLGCSLGRGMFGQRRGVRPFCEECSRPRRYVGAPDPLPCESCGRAVHQGADQRYRRHTFCCDQCAYAFYVSRANAAAKQRRSEARSPRPCATCAEVFEPTRADARFCCGACRQLAYRKRKAVTADECDASVQFASRNTVGPSNMTEAAA